MIVRIDNTGFENKGAELMLHAVLQEVRAALPEAALIFGAGAQNPARIRELGLGRVADDKVAGVKLRHVVPPFLLERSGLFSPFRADIVLDAAGYGLGDPWITPGYPRRRNEKLAENYRRLKQGGARIILLPQALGPFEKDLAKERFRIVAEHADLIYAREEVSLRHAQGVIGDVGKLRCAPDFTALCQPSGDFTAWARPGAFVVVPNIRMTTHSSAAVAAGYEAFMTRAALAFARTGTPVVILNHGGVEDGPLCQRIAKAVGGEFVDPPDALAVKAVIGGAKAVVSSRFHGVISALAQAVPVYCTSWSHKYPMAYRDFGVEPRILEVDGGAADPAGLAELLDEGRRARLRDDLVSGSVALKARVKAMWREIWGV
jgi:polysaccharide pyruvyl transferase WcaK-like protein